LKKSHLTETLEIGSLLRGPNAGSTFVVINIRVVQRGRFPSSLAAWPMAERLVNAIATSILNLLSGCSATPPNPPIVQKVARDVTILTMQTF
jgi:hypothetical protein